jgi:hypothetical protein
MKRHTPRPLHIAFAVIFSPIACSALTRIADTCARNLPENAADGTITFEGRYQASFEVSSFVPCGCDVDPGYGNGYWLTEEPGSGFFEEYAAVSSDPDSFTPGPAVYTRFEGTISELGVFGHLGSYLRQITVTRLLEMTSAAQCPQ